VVIGQADISNYNGTNQIVIGHQATGKGNNMAVIGDSQVTELWAAEDGQATVYAGGLVLEGATANAHETTLGVVDPTADATLNLPAMSAGTYYVPVLAAASTTAITSTPEELNILDASASNSVASDVANSAGAVTSNNYKISHTLTLNGNLDNDVEHADITITNNKVLATSVVMASANKNVNIDIHTVVLGSFKVRITNKSGSTLSDNSTIIINYIVL
jgi:hypothetical protein